MAQTLSFGLSSYRKLVDVLRPNRRIEADRRQRRFATLAPSAHAGR